MTTPADLREAVAEAGGLVAQADIARRFGLSPVRVHELVHDPSFPAPLDRVASKSDVWSARDIDGWMAARGHVRGSRA